MTNKDLMLEIIRYLEYRNKSVSDGYEWREINGLILQIKNNFEISDEEHDYIYHLANPTPTNLEIQSVEAAQNEIWK